MRILNTNETQPIKYSGFMDDGRLIVEFGGARYAVNPDNKRTDRID